MISNRGKFSKMIIAVGVFGFAVGLLASLNVMLSGKPDLLRSMGLVDDWTTHHVIFPNPGTATEAMRQGRYEQWYRIVNNPRYLMQQMKRKASLVGSTPNVQDYSTLSNSLAMPLEVPVVPAVKPLPKRMAPLKRDWAFSLGGGTVAQNQTPAKYNFYINATPSCTYDFVVYGLNVAESGTQANLVALNNLYVSTGGTGYCTGTAPTPYWAYEATPEGGTIPTSTTLSLDGSKVIYVESHSGGSYLHVLVWNSADGGTVGGPKTPAHVLTAGTAASTCATSYPGTSCLSTIALTATGITPSTITNSSPYYDYLTDNVYVGDDNGNLYKVTGAVNGGSTVTAVHLASTILTAPTYDESTYVYVGGTNGVLYAVTASTMTSAATLQVGKSSCGSGNNQLDDAPVVDVTNGWVYEYATDANNPSEYTIVEQASTAGPFTTTNTAEIGQGDNGCNSGSMFNTHLPAFDNAYYSNITTGHIWVCGRNGNSSDAELWEIATSGTSGAISNGSAAENSSQIQNSTSHMQCSPFTELYNTNNSTDYLFFGEGLSGSLGSLYGFTITGTTATLFSSGDPYTVPEANGATSGIAVDNIFSFPVWVKSTGYVTSPSPSLITDSSLNVEKCTTAGTSGSTAPTWNPTLAGPATTLRTAMTSGTTTAGVASTSGFATGEYILIDSEEMLITGITVSPASFTVTRARLGTTAVAHSTTGVAVSAGFTKDNTVIWANEGPNQTSSIYFTTLATSTTTCGGTSAYCAIKLTQAGLQ